MFKSVELAGGLVRADFVPYKNMRFVTVLDELWNTYPELILYTEGQGYKAAKSIKAFYLWRFAFAFGHTARLIIQPDTEPLAALKIWWTEDVPRGDYSTIYEAFTVIAPEGFMDEWYEGYEKTRTPVTLPAPVEIQPGAKAAAELNPFLALGGQPPSDASTKKSTSD